MQAQDVMTSPVVTVGPDATIDEVAGLLLEKGISASRWWMPEGSLFGMVSEADLLHRPEIDTQLRTPLAEGTGFAR
jgi:CBS domain-containing protein